MKATLDDSPIGQHDEGTRLFVLATLGDEAAANELYSRCVPPLRAWLAVRVGCDMAEDVAHDAIVRAFRKSTRFVAGAAFMPWLRTIAWHLAQKALRGEARRRARESGYFENERLCARIDADPDDRRRAALAECLAALPSQQFQLIRSRYFEGRSTDDIAREEGRSRVAVAVKLHRICRGLRGDVERWRPSQPAGSSLTDCFHPTPP